MSSRGVYSRVAQVESSRGQRPNETTTFRTRKVEKSASRKQLAENVSHKLQALLWIVLCSLIIYYTDFLKILVEDERVNRFWLNLSLVCFGICSAIAIYLIFVLPCFTPKVLGKDVDWNISAPRAIPAAAGSGVVLCISIHIALWPVYGLLTPVILGINFIAFIMTSHFIPTCGCC